ncbi:AzlD domain-containing protein [Candidatus Pelagibacter sp.]|jgi:branched-subunit amino acid transport protein|nr:AzlD domain-containing protein [Candidatus Pelagibacter sp.]
MASNILIVIIVTSIATYLSRFLGVLSSEKIKETSKIFRWFNCLAYSTLAALIARIVIFPSGTLNEVDYLVRFIVIVISIVIFYLTKKNLVYPTLFSAIILSLFSSYL